MAERCCLKSNMNRLLYLSNKTEFLIKSGNYEFNELYRGGAGVLFEKSLFYSI